MFLLHISAAFYVLAGSVRLMKVDCILNWLISHLQAGDSRFLQHRESSDSDEGDAGDAASRKSRAKSRRAEHRAQNLLVQPSHIASLCCQVTEANMFSHQHLVRA